MTIGKLNSASCFALILTWPGVADHRSLRKLLLTSLNARRPAKGWRRMFAISRERSVLLQ
jgi:hypothetical protein